MSHPKKIKWLLVLLAISLTITLYIVFLLIDAQGWKESSINLILNIIPNVIAVLVSFVVIYFFLTKKGISSQSEFINEIVEKSHEIFHGLSILQDEAQLNVAFDFKNRCRKAKSIDIVAISGQTFLSSFRDELTEIIKKGAKIRIVIIKSDSNAAKLVANQQEKQEIIQDLERSYKRIQQIQQSLSSSNPRGSFEVKVIDWIPSFSLVTLNNGKNDVITKVKIYPLDIDYPLYKIENHYLIEKTIYPDLFNYYEQNFISIWEKASPI